MIRIKTRIRIRDRIRNREGIRNRDRIRNRNNIRNMARNGDMIVVNALLLKISLKLYQSRQNTSAIQVNKDTTHLALNATQERKQA